jgi:hypothetical protein
LPSCHAAGTSSSLMTIFVPTTAADILWASSI